MRTREAVQSRFIDMLLGAIDESPLSVVLTLRADFYGQAIALSDEFSDRLESGVINLGDMTPEQLRGAIEQPAIRARLTFESGLVDRILDHVAAQPGALPLLEYALSELWLRRDGNRLTHAAYDRIGGVPGAITKRAEIQFSQLSEAQRQIALPALAQLVNLSSPGDAGNDTRRSVALREFSADAQAVMRTFAEQNARLVVTGRDEVTGDETVQLAHEALIHGWSDLHRWLEKDREFILWRQRVLIAANEWRSRGFDDSLLWRGSNVDMIDIASGCAKRTYKSNFWRNRCVNHHYFLICTQGKS